MVLISYKKNLTISCFKTIRFRSIYGKLSNRLSNYQIPYLKHFRKNLVTKRFSKEQKLNTKKSSNDADLKYFNNKPEKSKTQKRNIILPFLGENERVASININYYLNARDISIRQLFQITIST